MPEFKLSQTALKDLENPQTCPKRWKGQWIDREFSLAPNEAMKRGSYFELGVLGAGAIPGSETSDLPRLKSGDKSAVQKRIDEQIERVRGMLFDEKHPEYLGLKIAETQLAITTEDRSGVIDIVAYENGIDVPMLLDLKLTADLESDYGPYAWGNDWRDLDLVQLPHYADLYHEQFGIKPRTGYIIADYSTKKNVLFGELLISSDKFEEKERRFTDALNVIKLYEDHGWVVDPSIEQCQLCKLQCEHRVTSQVIKKVVKY